MGVYFHRPAAQNGGAEDERTTSSAAGREKSAEEVVAEEEPPYRGQWRSFVRRSLPKQLQVVSLAPMGFLPLVLDTDRHQPEYEGGVHFFHSLPGANAKKALLVRLAHQFGNDEQKVDLGSLIKNIPPVRGVHELSASGNQMRANMPAFAKEKIVVVSGRKRNGFWAILKRNEVRTFALELAGEEPEVLSSESARDEDQGGAFLGGARAGTQEEGKDMGALKAQEIEPEDVLSGGAEDVVVYN